MYEPCSVSVTGGQTTDKTEGNRNEREAYGTGADSHGSLPLRCLSHSLLPRSSSLGFRRTVSTFARDSLRLSSSSHPLGGRSPAPTGRTEGEWEVG